jgi:hypothetical protein
MAHMGHSRRFWPSRAESAFHPGATEPRTSRKVAFVPIASLPTAGKQPAID